MTRPCIKHPYQPSESICRSCGMDFCADCLVYPHGPKKLPLCLSCAVAEAGVRSTARNGRMGRRELRRRAKARRADARAGMPDEPTGPVVFEHPLGDPESFEHRLPDWYVELEGAGVAEPAPAGPAWAASEPFDPFAGAEHAAAEPPAVDEPPAPRPRPVAPSAPARPDARGPWDLDVEPARPVVALRPVRPVAPRPAPASAPAPAAAPRTDRLRPAPASTSAPDAEPGGHAGRRPKLAELQRDQHAEHGPSGPAWPR